MMLIAVGLPLLLVRVQPASAARKVRRITLEKYVDKMKAGWVGQMAGVGWGAPTEFRYKGTIIPEDKMPAWRPEMINQFNQDDVYVEMTFLRTLELHGLDVPIRQAGIDFANSRYKLWHANKAGRTLLRSGIAPPDSGHPAFNKHADDIDYQIESDFSGLIAPGMPNIAIELGEKFGRLMNYGDGLYGGQFVGGMYAEAFFESDPERIVRSGLECIPKGSQYHRCICDVLKWYHEYPDDWQKTWRLIEEKYNRNAAYRRFSCSGPDSIFNIDAKLNGAYIVMGLLYGKGDPDNTIIISTRCGQDSDCNPSNAAGVLFTTIGYEKLPDKFKSALNPAGKFSHTPYDFPTLVEVCKKLVRQALKRTGGHIEKDEQGREVFVIPVEKPRPGRLEQCWEPGPIANSRFTTAEMALITAPAGKDLSKAIAKFAPGWKVTGCGEAMNPGFYERMHGRKNVLATHPLNRTTGCVLSRTLKLPAGKKTTLALTVGHDPNGDWVLIVRVDGEELLKKTIGEVSRPRNLATGVPGQAAANLWTDLEIDLCPYAGKEIKLELVNQPNGWHFEAAYWAKIDLVEE